MEELRVALAEQDRLLEEKRL